MPRPSLADARWTVFSEIDTSLLDWGTVDVLVATEQRTVAAGNRAEGFGRLLIAEQIDGGNTWVTTFNDPDARGAVVAGAVANTVAYIVGCSDLGGTVWHSTSVDAEWITTVVSSSVEADVCGVDISISDGLFAVAGQAWFGDRSEASVWLSDNGEVWTQQALDTVGDFDALATSVAVSGDTIVVGGSVSNGVGRTQEPFDDETWDKPTVWVSTDRGTTWKQIELLPSGDVRGRVRDIAVLGGQFVAIGFVESVADWLEITDTDVAVWSSEDAVEWSETTLAEPGQQAPMLAAPEAGRLYVVGRSRSPRVEDVDPIYGIAIWSYKDGDLLLENVQEMEDFGAFWMTAIAALDSRWLVAGMGFADTFSPAELFLMDGSLPGE